MTANCAEAGAQSAWTTTTTWKERLAERKREFGSTQSSGLRSMSPVACGRAHGVERARARVPGGDEARISSFAELVTAALADVDARDSWPPRARIVEAADAARDASSATSTMDPSSGSSRLPEPPAARAEFRAEPAATRQLAVARAELDAALGDPRARPAGSIPASSPIGSQAALAAVAGRSTVPVELDLDGCGELPLSVRRRRSSSSSKR